jgi:hypothetical protein
MTAPTPQELYQQHGFFWNAELDAFVEHYWGKKFEYVRESGGHPTWAAFNPQNMIQLGRRGGFDELFDDVEAVIGEDVVPVGSADGNNLDLLLSKSGVLIAAAENLVMCWGSLLNWREAIPLLISGSEPQLIAGPNK